LWQRQVRYALFLTEATQPPHALKGSPVKFEVKGTILPVLEATLDAGETVISTHGDLG